VIAAGDALLAPSVTRRPALSAARIAAVLLGDCAEATLAVSDAELGDLRAGVTTRTSSLMPNSGRCSVA